MATKYSETDALRIVKDLFNLLHGDSKRFVTLRNKFKKSVAEFKVKDDKIVSVIFNAVGNDVINQELNDAIESLRGYAARSAKKQAEFDAIIAGEGINVEEAKAGKPKSIKVAKASDGKVKKVAKDSSLPKEKEPKEVKKVKNKNEPAKKPTKAKSAANPAKEKPTKTSKAVASTTKAKEEVNNVEVMISKFVNGLEPRDLSLLIKDASDAFAGDSKLNITMQNWKTKSKNDFDAASGMLKTAYTRKPKNTKMQNWYKKLEATFMAPEKPVEDDLVAKQKEAVKEMMVPETPVVNCETPKEESKTEETGTPVVAAFHCIPGILSKKIITDFSRFKAASSSPEVLAEIFGDEIPMVRHYDLNNDKFNSIQDAITTLQGTVFGLLDTTPDELISIEAEILSKKILNSSITSTFMQNFIMYITKAPGLGTLAERKECLEAIKYSILEFLEMNKINTDTNAEDTFKFYMDNTLKLTMLQVYTLNRYILTSILSLASIAESDKMVCKILEIVLPYFVSANYFELIKMDGIPFYMHDLDIESTDVDETKEEPKEAVGETTQTEEAKSEETQKELPKQPEIKYTITYSELSFVLNGTQITMQKSDDKYPAVLEAVTTNDYDALNKLIVTETSIKENIQSFLSDTNINGMFDVDDEALKIKIDIVDKMLMCNGKKFGGKLSLEFIQYAAQNDVTNIAQFKRFIYNCSLNPSSNSVNELYDFVIKNALKVTPSGSVLLYKWVRDNYFDQHTGKFDNHPGKTVWMDRSKVNDNRNETCSNGLHLCSFGYSKFSQRLLICELHPKNAVSIPSDYNQSKMRCCEYSVLLDVTEYYSEMLSKGDYLSKGTTFHHNSKILELAIMKQYPNVKRVNSFNGFNGKTGNDVDFKDIDFSVPLPKIEDRVEFTEDTDETPETCVPVPTDEALGKEIEEVVTEETPVVEEEVKEEPKEEVKEASCSAHTMLQEVEEESKNMEPDMSTMNTEIFIDYMLTGNTDVIRKVPGHEEFIKGAHNFGLDTIILDIVLTNLKLSRMDLKKLDVYTVVEIYSNYRKAINNETSVVDRTTEDIKNAKETESSKAIDEQHNSDGTKVVETPNTTSTGIFGKIKKLFGGK